MFGRFGAALGLLFGASAVLATGCGGGGTAGGQSNLRFMNAVPDQTSINVLVDGTVTGGSVAYGSETSYSSAKSGQRHIQIEPATASNFFFDQMVTINSGVNNTFIAAGISTTPTSILLTDSTTAPASGQIQLRLVNAAPNVLNTDIYVVAPGTNLNTVQPKVSSLGFGSSSQYLSLTAGSYEIFFTSPGSTFALLDTGSISYTAGQNRTVVLLRNLAGNYEIVTLSDLN
jgi:hypothetical protein